MDNLDTYFMFGIGGIWCESSLIRLYRIKDVKVKE